ncbi:hypothetical protein [Paludisphaera mucosa]|uniref:Uncharacterized protein n=1 Tax=Paludisphaera mucosa TaxID=3030827 RepID=A0ABT6F5K3_9BACT|nr:hypothetical protein [Paludisphaera mucosa]MDG3002856.1 hypothetical protein [Paludisphaera mucosa]
MRNRDVKLLAERIGREANAMARGQVIRNRFRLAVREACEGMTTAERLLVADEETRYHECNATTFETWRCVDGALYLSPLWGRL